MIVESRILNYINKFLSQIQDKTDKFREKSYILSNIDNILFIFICSSIVISIFAGNNTTAVLLCIVSFLYFMTYIFQKGTRVELNRSTIFLMLYLCIAVASTINSTMIKASITGISKTVLYLIYFSAAAEYLRKHKEKIRIIIVLIGICVSFEVVAAFLQNNIHVMSAATWQDISRLNPEYILTRVYGTLKPLNPNLLGGYFIAAVPFLWISSALFWIEKKYKLFYTGAIFSIASISGIFMTGCRGAYIALFVMTAVTSIFIYNILKTHYPNSYTIVNKHKKGIIIWLIGLSALIMTSVPKISHRILSIFAMRNDSSTSFRMNVYQSSIQMIQDNILLGIGCGNKVFREIYGLYMRSGFDALSAYSIYIETAVESGIIALIFYILFIIFLIKDGIESYKRTKDIKTKTIIASGIISIIGVLVHGFVDTIYYRPQIQIIFWIAVAIVTIYTNEQGKINA